MGAWPVVWCQGRDHESGGRRSSRNVFELPPPCLLRLFVGYSHNQSSRLCRRPVCLTHLRPHAIVLTPTEAELLLSLDGDRPQCWNRLKRSGWTGNLSGGGRPTSICSP